MSKKIIIIGTDTDIGKTYISALIMQNFNRENSIYIKPIQTGFPNYSDEGFVKKFSNCNTTTILKFKAPASPHLSAKLDDKKINTDKLVKKIKLISSKYEYSVIELAGGILVPVTEKGYTNLDLISDMGCDKIALVTRPNLGTLNHTLLTLLALKSIGIKKEQIIVVMNFAKDEPIDYIIQDNIDYLSNLTNLVMVKNGQKKIKI